MSELIAETSVEPMVLDVTGRRRSPAASYRPRDRRSRNNGVTGGGHLGAMAVVSLIPLAHQRSRLILDQRDQSFISSLPA